MCFKNLPIEFDAQGRAHLREGVANPYSYVANGHPVEREERVRELLAGNGHIKEVSIDPVTRVAGALAFHSVVDLENRTVHDAHSMATLFRGYEIILKGRDPRDAIFISSRACGVCGGVPQQLMDGYDAMIVVDAVDRHAAPGSVFVLDPQVADPHALSTDEWRQHFSNLHLAEPSRILLLARAAGVLPSRVILVGCQPERIEEFEPTLTPTVQRAVPVAAARALELATSMLASPVG
jgi:hydrogenase maturation protease